MPRALALGMTMVLLEPVAALAAVVDDRSSELRWPSRQEVKPSLEWILQQRPAREWLIGPGTDAPMLRIRAPGDFLGRIRGSASQPESTPTWTAPDPFAETHRLLSEERRRVEHRYEEPYARPARWDHGERNAVSQPEPFSGIPAGVIGMLIAFTLMNRKGRAPARRPSGSPAIRSSTTFREPPPMASGDLSWETLLEVAEHWAARGDHPQEEKVLRLALRKAGPSAGAGVQAAILGRLCDAKRGQGEPCEAESLARQACELLAAADNVAWLDVLYADLKLAGVLLDQKRYEEVDEVQRRWRETLDCCGPADAAMKARALCALARLPMCRDQVPEAESLLNQCVALYDNGQLPEDDSLHAALFGLAGLHMRRGRHRTAATLLKQSLAVHERLGQEKSESYVMTLQQLAITLHRSGATGDAEAVCQRMLGVREAIHGPDHLSLAGNLSQLLWLNSHLGRFERAQEYLDRFLGLLDCADDPDRTAMAGDLADYVSWLERHCFYAEAATLASRVRSLRPAISLQSPDSASETPWRWN